MIATNAPGMMNRFFWNQGLKSLVFASAVLASAFGRFGSVEFSDKVHSYSCKFRGFFSSFAKLALSGELSNPYSVEVATPFESGVGFNDAPKKRGDYLYVSGYTSDFGGILPAIGGE